MRIMKYLSMAAFALMGAMTIASCDNEDNALVEEPVVAQNNIVTVTTTISLDGGSDATTTRALTIDEVNHKGVKTFAVGDQVALSYLNTTPARVKAVSKALKAEDISTDKKTATLTFELENPANTDKAVLVYPASFLVDGTTLNTAGLTSEQDGTLATLQKKFDACFSISAFEVNGDEVTFGDVPDMKNPFSICKFTVNDGTTDITSKITQLTVTNKVTDIYVSFPVIYTINRTPADGPIYVAILPTIIDPDYAIEDLGYLGGTGNTSFTFTASDGTNGYEKSSGVTGKELAANTIYPINVTMTKDFDGLATPLTFEVPKNTSSSSVGFSLASDLTGSVKYRTKIGAADWGGWTAYTSNDVINLSSGDKVQFCGNNATYYVNNTQSSFFTTGECYVYGNIMSLVAGLDGEGDFSTAFASITTLTEDEMFRGLFSGNDKIISHASKPLVLPATTLTVRCYMEMFNGCTGLTTAPALPAMTLAISCYNNMFHGCTGLTTAPALPATTLANYCYRFMFSGCTGLTTAPALPATTMAYECYYHMFYNCTGLTTAPATLPADELATNCYYGMFSGCTGLTTAPALPAEELATDCYYQMFYNCTGLTTAPVLPATTLAGHCYREMFKGCEKLSSVTCLATNINASYCTYQWLDGAGTAEGCDRKLYVASTDMLDPASDGWKLETSGEDGKRWTTAVAPAP